MRNSSAPKILIAKPERQNSKQIQDEGHKKLFHTTFISFVVFHILSSGSDDFDNEDLSAMGQYFLILARICVNGVLTLLFHLHSQVDTTKNIKKSNILELAYVMLACVYYIASDSLWFSQKLQDKMVNQDVVVLPAFTIGLEFLLRFFIVFTFVKKAFSVMIYVVIMLGFYLVISFIFIDWLVIGRIFFQALIMIGIILHGHNIKIKSIRETQKLKNQERVHKTVLDSLPESTMVLTDKINIKFINRYMNNIFDINNKNDFDKKLKNFTSLNYRGYVEDNMLKSLPSRTLSMTVQSPTEHITTSNATIGVQKHVLPFIKNLLPSSSNTGGLVKLEELERINSMPELLDFLKENVEHWRKSSNFTLVFDTKYNYPSGVTASIELRVYVFHSENEVEFVFVFRDTTDRDRIATLRSENAVYRNNVIASFSHELRTPLNSNLGLLEHCMDCAEIPNSIKKRIIEPALISAKMLLCLVSDLLDYSEYLNEKLVLQVKKANLQKTMVNCMNLFEDRFKQKNVTCEVVTSEMGHGFYTDHNRVGQVLISLLSNSLKFTNSGKVTISLKHEYGDVYRMSVTDTGIGMDEDTQAKLKRNLDSGELKEKVSNNSAGVGIGLFIANALAYQFSPGKNHGLKFTSKKGEETTFYFLIENCKPRHTSVFLTENPLNLPTLPSISGELEENEESINVLMRSHLFLEKKRLFSAEPTTPFLSQKKRKVLIVDDEVFNIMIIETFCRSFGVATERAFNGKEAIDKILKNGFDNSIKLVLTDVNMPIMDGYETTLTLKKLMREDQISHIPIVGVTAYVSKEKIDKCYEVGMEDVLNKPLAKNSFLHVLKKYGFV